MNTDTSNPGFIRVYPMYPWLTDVFRFIPFDVPLPDVFSGYKGVFVPFVYFVDQKVLRFYAVRRVTASPRETRLV